MGKTRKQTHSSPIKDEDFESERKSIQLLHSVSNTAKNKSKITKSKATRQRSEPVSPKIKLEEETENKSLLQAPSHFENRYTVTEEKARQLISHVKDDKMTARAASEKVNISYNKGRKYYNTFLMDPNRESFVSTERNRKYTHQQIKTLIECIENEKLSVQNASLRTDMPEHIGYAYYKEYCGDPNHSIPIPHHLRPKTRETCSQDQITKLIGYIVDDGMTLATAALKAKMHVKTARRYYLRYLDDPDHTVPAPRIRIGTAVEACTQEKLKKLIGYIVDDKMSIPLAAVKAKMSESTARHYYLQYMNSPNREIPIPKRPTEFGSKTCTQEQIRQLIGYLVNDNMSMRVAAVKANMCNSSAKRYYKLYMEDPNHEIPAPRKNTAYVGKPITQDQIKETIGYIVNDKMSMRKAAMKTNISTCAARKYYLQYLNDPNHAIPVPYHIADRASKICTQEQINKLIRLMVNDNMSVEMASIKAKMSKRIGEKYYRLYLEDPDHKIPTPRNHFCTDEQIQSMISYVVNDKIPVNRAAKLANMGETTAHRYYHRYLDQK